MNAHGRPFSVYFGLIGKCLFSFIITLFLVLPSLAQDFTARNIGDYGNVTVMEVSGNYDAPEFTSSMLARQVIAKEFLKTHKDEYDFLVVFSNFDFIMPEFETLAFYNPVRNDIRGIGHDVFDNSSLYGSSGRLQGTIDMGNIAANVSDPLNPKFDRTLSILAHEFLHRWGSYVKFKDWNGATSTKLIGHEGSHWSFLLDTKGSVEYGNQWQDNGNGTFTSGGTGNKFSPLDLYLMGMIDKSEVPPMLLIENDSVDHTRLPEPGVTISGTPRTVTIDDIIAAEGERLPSAQNSQKQFKTAFIFISTPGSFTGRELDGIENIRNGFLTRFSILTDGKALVQVASTPKEDLPSNPGVRPPTTTPRTLPPNVEDGVRWLTEHQLADGSWTDFALTTERDTAESVTTLQRFPVAQQQFQAGLAWLSGNASANTDFLARRLEAAAQTGADTAGLVSELLSRRNTDGGWGSGKNFISNSTDTALALKALSRAGFADQQVIAKSIEWLKSAQNGDGGWSGSDAISTIQPTAAVLSVFNTYRKSFSLDDSVVSAIAFLSGKQNTDGGFGNSPSTVYDSAVAVIALQESGADKEMVGKGVAYLDSLQGGDGSWQESPYQTALAVRAVWQASVDPDLSIKADDITFIPDTITTLPTTAVLNAVISNLGRSDVAQAKVFVYDGAVTPEKKVAEQSVAFPGQGPVTVTFAIPITDGNGHVFHVVVDPENLVKESDEYNNSAVKALYPQPTHDFVVAPAGVTVTPNPVDNGQQVTVKAVIANKGTADAFNVPVRFFVDDAAAPIEIATVNVDIPAGGSVTKEITWQASRAGNNMPVTVMADPAGAFTENDEGNNKAVVPLTVNPVVFTDPNLTISYKEIVVTPNPVSQNGSVNISATVRNEGVADAADVQVEFYKGVPGVDGVLLGSQRISLLHPLESAVVSIPWTDISEAGEKVIYVKADPANAIKEISEADNAAFTKLTIASLADLAVYSSSISFTPHAPREGEPVSVAVTVFNKGDLPVSNVTVQAFDGTASLGTQGISSIAGNSQAIVSFPLDTTGKAGSHQITASAAADASAVEQSIANNSAVATLIVYKADLMLSEPYFSPNGDGVKDTTRFSFRLETPQTVTVEVANKNGDVIRSFSGNGLTNVTDGSVVWDGYDAGGVIADDGEYRIRARSASGAVLSDVMVVVDNDRASLVDALLSGATLSNDLSCHMPSYVFTSNYGNSLDTRTWLPDGTGAVFNITDWGNSSAMGLFKVAPDGSAVDRITTSDFQTANNRAVRSFTPSPDATKVAFMTSSYTDVTGTVQVWVMNSDGSNVKLLYTTNNTNDYVDKDRDLVNLSEPIVWSPDNKTIAFSSNQWFGWPYLDTRFQTGTKSIVSVDTETLQRKTLISYPTTGYGGSTIQWSPSGSRILASDYRCLWGSGYACYNDEGSLYISDSNGENQRHYTHWDYIYSPIWVSDNSVVANDGQYFINNFNLYSMFGGRNFVLSPDKKSMLFFFGELYNGNRIYDTDFKPIKEGLPTCPEGSRPYKFTPDGKKLLCYGSTIGILDIAEAKMSVLDNAGYTTKDYYSLRHSRLNWIDNQYAVEQVTIDDKASLYLVDTATGSKKFIRHGYLDEKYSEMPAYRNVLFFQDQPDRSPKCVPKNIGSYYNPYSVWSTETAANLIAELVPVRQNSQVMLTGTASDANFEGYKLEYALAEAPDQWYSIISYGETPITNNNFGGWVPPAEGNYFVRLTVWDKAGNRKTDRKKVSWGKYSPITELYKSYDVFSPNGDSVKDTVSLMYRVLEPLHVEITVFDQNNNAVKVFARDYTAPAADSVTWDGKNEAGAVVPDGSYRLRIADYDFFVKVDNSAPEVALTLSNIGRGSDPKYFDVVLAGRTFDNNLKQWTVEYGEGDNPQQWYTYKSGSGVLAAHDSSNNVIYPVADTVIETFSNQKLGWLAGKKFRITAEDYAGKKTSAVTGFVEEKIALYFWGGDLVVGDVLNSDQSKPGLQVVEAVETIRTPLASAVLQYLSRGEWVDAQTITPSDSGALKVAWDNSALNLSRDYQVRIKAIDSAGREFYSNTLQASQPNNQFKIWSLCSDDSTTLSLLAENPYDSLSRLSFQIKSSQDSRYPDWTDFGGAASGGTVPVGTLYVPRPDIKAGTSYEIRMVGTAVNGASYVSDVVTHPSACAVELALDVKNAEADCGSAPGASNILAQIKKLNAESVPQTLTYYLQKPDGPQLLRKLDLSREPWGGTVLETAGLPAGNYQLRAVLTFLDPSIDEVKAAQVTGDLVVDHMAPISSITYPTPSLQLCANSIKTSTGNWFGVPVEGIVGDETKVKRFELLYGVGDNPVGWLPAKSRSGGTPADIKGTSAVKGEIGMLDVTNVGNSDLSLKLKVVDSAGNASCSTTTLHIKPVPEVRSLASSAYVISPNGDGVSDSAVASYSIDGSATVEIKVFPLSRSTDGSLVLGSTPVKTVSPSHYFSGGYGNSEWDGKNDAGVVVADGMYAIAVSAMDGCSNSSFKWVALEVDKTPPTSVITYPKPGDALGVVAEVRGTVDDAHFRSYILEAGEGDEPSSWFPVAMGAAQVKDGVLGKWNTFGRQGRWTLRLTAEDGSGNKSKTSVPLDLAVRQMVIKGVDASPKVFSPNSDGKLETSVISYEVTDASQVKIELVNAAGTVVRDYTTTTVSAGTFNFLWDAKGNAGTPVGDGIYVARITAALVANPAVSQVETVTVSVDTTQPRLEVAQPLDNSFVNKVQIPVVGTVDDPNLASYSVTLSGAQGALPLDSGSQARSAYTFGTLNDAAEGSYTLTIEGKDSAGNSALINRSFTVDRTAPAPSLITPKNDEYYGAKRNVVSMSGSVEEKNLERYALRYGSGTNPYSWKEVSSGSTPPAAGELYSWKVGQGDGVFDGVYTVSLWAKDKAGTEKDVRAKVTIDNTKPTVSISSPVNGSYIKAPFSMYGTLNDNNFDKGVLEMSEGACSTAYKWSTVKSFSSPFSYNVVETWDKIPSDGEYCLKLSGVDKLGNEAMAMIAIKVDTVPPTAPVLKGALENQAEAALQWGASPEADVAGYNLYRGTQKLNAALLSQLNYRDLNLKEGVYPYTVKAVDFAGNESLPSSVVKVVIDTTPPAARITVPSDGARVGGEVEIRGMADSQDDFKQYRVYLGSGSTPTGWNLIRTSPAPTANGLLAQWDTLSIQEGVYSIKLEAEDLSGNVNTQRVAVTVDNTPPAKPQLLSAVTSGSDVTITWTGSSDTDVAGYLLYKNDKVTNASSVSGSLKGYLLTGTTYVDRGMPDGKYSYYIIAMDQGGNLSDQSNTVTVNVDAHAPHAVLTQPAVWVKFSDPLLLQSSCADLDVASVQYQYKKSTDSSWSNLGTALTSAPYTSYFDPKGLGLPYALYQIRPVATDLAGHADSTPEYREVTYDDVVAPAAPAGFKADVKGNEITLTWDPNQETDLKGYNIVRRDSFNWTTLNYNPIVGNSYVDKNVYDGRYTYEIDAVDKSNNKSPVTKTGYVKVYAPVLVQPYSPVTTAAVTLQGSGAEPGSSVLFTDVTGAGTAPPVAVTADSSGNFKAEGFTLAPGENRITAKATDAAGNVSKSSAEIVIAFNEAPAAPTGLVAVVQGYDVDLSWNANQESDIAGYNLYRDGEKVNKAGAITQGTASASSMYEYYDWYRYPYYVAYKPSNAFDGNPDTYWASYGYGTSFGSQWWQLELPAKEFFRGLEIKWWVEKYSSGSEVSYAGKNFEIQAWNGTAWVTLEKVTGNSAKITTIMLKQPYATTKVRVYITATNDPASRQVRIAEVTLSKENLIKTIPYRDANLKDGKYLYTLTAVDNYGYESSASNQAPAEVGDVIAPAAPTSLTATVSGSSVSLGWLPPAETDLAGYNVYRSAGDAWIKVNSAAVAGAAYTDNEVKNGSYSYRVTAVDAVGNESAPSDVAAATIYTELPPTPQNLKIAPVPQGGALVVTWDAVGGSAASYNLYRSMTAGAGYIKIASLQLPQTSYTDTGLSNGSTYYYTVVSADLLGNESARSAEVAGTTADTVPPSIPLLAFPGTSGSRIVTYDGTTDIAGTADPDAQVELLKDGLPVGTTSPVETIDVFKLSFDTGGNWVTVSPLGNSIAYPSGSQLLLQDLSGTTTVVGNSGYGPVWNASGTKIAFLSRNNYWRYKIAVYDLASGTTNFITTDQTSNDSSVSWSDDGNKMLYSNDKSGYYDLYLKDLSTGGTTKLTSWIYPYYPKLSPDGTLVAYFDYNNLKIVNGSTAVAEQVDTYAVYSSKADWSPDSRKVAFVSTRNNYQNLYYYDTVTKGITALTNTTNGKPGPLAWSPEGSQVAYIRSENDGTYALWLADLNGNNKVVQQKLPAVTELRWKKNGDLLYVTGTGVNTVFLGSHFVFRGIPLDAGENIFYTRAIDPAGNVSDSSDKVRVSYDTRKVADVSIAQEDIFIYPPFPKPGEEMSVNVLVRNNNKTEPIQSVDAEVYAWDGAGELTLLKAQTLSISANYAAEISANLNAGFTPGAHSIIVVIDSGNKIKELNEGNNYASADFYVTDKEEMVVTASLDNTEYNANTQAALTVTVGNSGSPKNGSLTVDIEDADGNTLASLGTTALSVSYGPGEPLSYRWNTGTSLAGSYKAHAVFTAFDGAVTESVALFTILPDFTLETGLATDKQGYGANEQVTISFSIKNGGSNYIAPETGATIKVLDAGNAVLFREERNLGNLFPGSVTNLSTAWETGVAAPGTYRVVLEVSAAGTGASSTTQPFTINPSSRVTGTVSVDPTVVPAGGGFRAAYTLSNAGNAAADGTVKAVVVDPDSGAIVQFAESAVVMPVGATRSGEFSLTSSGLQTKSYQVRLRYLSEGRETDISGASIKVQDVMPPVVTAVSPLAGATYKETISFAAQASDDGSGLSLVEYQLDGRGWQSLPVADYASGKYAVTWSPTRADSGVHTVSFRATDRANNTSIPVSTTFNFEYGTDYLPPVLWLSTLSDGASTADQTLNIAGTVWDDTAVQVLQVNGTDVPINSDGSFSYALPLQIGSNLVTTVAADQAGNRTMDQRTIKRQSANLTVVTPADNSKTALSLATVSGTADAAATVNVSVAGVAQNAVRDGETFSADVTLLPGFNTILITATAPDGFAASAKRTVLYDDQKPSLAVTDPSQDIRTNQGSIMIKGTADDPWTAVGVTIEFDGRTLTPSLVNGSFEQLVALTEEKPYAINVTATNEVGTQVTVQRNIIHDTTAPLLVIDPVPTQTNQADSLVTGRREEGTEVSVACATAAVGEVSYPSPTTWSVTLSGLQLGPNTVTAASSDAAGNPATASATIYYIEKASEVTLTATPALIWPPDRKLVPVTLEGEVVPHGSDLQSVSLSVADEYGEFAYSNLKFGDTILLEAWRKGDDLDGRVYTITAVATDRAGNTTTKTAIVRVFHDQSK